MTQTATQPRAQGKQPEALKQFLEEGRRLRQRTLELMAKAGSLGGSFQLPPPGDAFAVARDRLSSDEYQVLVVGEVKRGKSTLVNALTGLRLPTDVDVATSQVFRIRHSDRPYYRVRYEGGGEREIGESELGNYGSQVVIDANGDPDPGRSIRWIEVGLPYSFLPRNVCVLDTPGVGGSKAAHGEITHRFLPQADAVIFVLDSDRPIDDAEVRFLDAVLRGTRHVFFVQTKIDIPKESEWEAIRAKSQAQLQAKFGDRLGDTTVWPLSSTLLQKAAPGSPHADLRLIESRHREFGPALSAFLYRVVGWSRSADATLLAEHYHRGGNETLTTRHRSLADTSRRVAEDLKVRLQTAKRALEDESSGFNRGRNRAFDKLRDEARKAVRWVEDQIGAVDQELRSRIDHVSSVVAARELGGELADVVVERASELWRDVRHDASDLYSSLLSDLLIEAEEEFRFADRTLLRSPPEVPKLEGDFLNRVYVARNHAMSAGFTAAVPAGVLLAAGMLTAPLAISAGIVGSVATIWGLISGWRSAGRSESNAAKGRLHGHLDKVVRTVLKSSLRGVDDLFRTLEGSLREQTDRLAAQKRSEAEAELSRLQDEERMTHQQRADEAKKLDGQMTQWRNIGEELAATRIQLRRLYDGVAPRNGGAN